jgi:predicted  nucleic acid-binding Zn-ribbon protein
MKQILLICLCVICFASCTQSSGDYQKVQAENDSLRLQLTKNESELNEMLETLNAIESDIQTIRTAENYLNVEKDTELSSSRREQIKSNMSLVIETLKKNKQELSELQEKLNKSNVRSSALQKTIDRITNDLNEKSVLIVQLQQDLGKKDAQIQQMSQQVESLNTDVQILEDVNSSQNDLINQQDQTLNTVFYCFGTKKELSEQNILSGGGLFSKSKTLQDGFNKDYFISTDKRNLSSIPLFAHKAKVHTSHPSSSYKLVQDNEGNLTLRILNFDAFWSLSKYLVIEVS